MSVPISSVGLKRLVKLAQRKTALMTQLQNIDRDMLRLEREFRRKMTGAGLRKGRLTFSTSPGKRRSKRRSAARRKKA